MIQSIEPDKLITMSLKGTFSESFFPSRKRFFTTFRNRPVFFRIEFEFSSKSLLWISRNLNVDYTPKLWDWHFQSAIEITDVEISYMNSVLWKRLYISAGKFFRGNEKFRGRVKKAILVVIRNTLPLQLTPRAINRHNKA